MTTTIPSLAELTSLSDDDLFVVRDDSELTVEPVKKVRASTLKTFLQSAGILTESYHSAEQTITAGGALTLAHGMGSKPTLMQAYLVCKVAEHNFAIDDEVFVSCSAGSGEGMNVRPDATNLNIRFGADTETFFLNDNDTGLPARLTNANWRLRVRAWA